MELNSTDRKALEKKKELLETRLIAISDALGAKSAIILVGNDGKVLCKSSLAAPGFHLLMETISVQNLIATHITECTSSNLLTTVMVSSLRSEASQKTILAQLVKDLQFRSGRMAGPYLPRSLSSNESRAMEVSRMSIPQLIEMLKRYASEGYKPHRSVREWLEDHESLTPRRDTNPEKFCTGATMKYLKPSTRKADDGRTSGNASEAKREGWRQQGALNLNNNKKSGDNSQQQHDDEDVINGSDDDDQINDSDEDRQINVGDDVEQASVGDGGEKEEDEEKEKETEQFISSSVEEEDNNSTGSSIQLFVPNKNGTQKRKAPKTKVTIAGGKMSNNNKTAAGSAAATAASMRSTTTTAAKRKTPNNAGVTAAVAASSATTSSTSSTKRNKEKPERYRN